MAHLEGYSAQGRKVFSLPTDAVTAGRANDAGIRLEGDGGISRLHALFERLEGGWRLSDLGSRNGTFVNDHRIAAPVALRPGDEIQIGAWRLAFFDEHADGDGTLLDADTRLALPDAASVVDLSMREREVLTLLARGDTDEQIAGELFISVATVRSHLDRIRDKTGCRRRPELTRYAVEQGIVPPRRDRN